MPLRPCPCRPRDLHHQCFAAPRRYVDQEFTNFAARYGLKVFGDGFQMPISTERGRIEIRPRLSEECVQALLARQFSATFLLFRFQSF